MKKVIFFDLDNTLIKFDEEVFIKTYLNLLATNLSKYGYDQNLPKHIWAGTILMYKNDGKLTNEQVFWNYFKTIYGQKGLDDFPLFEKFYQTDFDKVSAITSKVDGAKELVEFAKANFDKVVLSTNPLFPRIATEKRITWAGLSPTDFDYITSYENSSFCKPSTSYYIEICEKLGISTKDVVMVGNSDLEDFMPTKALGIPCFITKENRIISDKVTSVTAYPLKEIISELKKIT